MLLNCQLAGIVRGVLRNCLALLMPSRRQNRVLHPRRLCLSLPPYHWLHRRLHHRYWSRLCHPQRSRLCHPQRSRLCLPTRLSRAGTFSNSTDRLTGWLAARRRSRDPCRCLHRLLFTDHRWFYCALSRFDSRVVVHSAAVSQRLWLGPLRCGCCCTSVCALTVPRSGSR